MADGAESIHELIEQADSGDSTAKERLLEIAYAELRQVADRYLRRERDGHTLQPTALVHEAYLRLFGKGEIDWNDHAHFVRTSARAMRRILVDHARKRQRDKRGGGAHQVTYSESAIQDSNEQPETLLSLNDSLDRLQAMDPRQAEIVEMLYFTGLTQQETAQALGLSEVTVRREWRSARAWLWSQLRKEAPA